MSQEERLLILQMVADKKITASEGADLLRALDAKGATPSTPPWPPSRPSAGGFLDGLSGLIEDVVEKVTEAVQDFDRRPWFEYPSQLEGVFEGENIPLWIRTHNGHIAVKGWDQPGYQAHIRVKVRDDSEASARVRSQDAFDVSAGPEGFRLEARRHDRNDIAVHVTLMVPMGKTYRLETASGNGHIELENVVLVDGKTNSGNGRITFRGGAADRLHLRTGNGSVELSADIADLDAGSGNGSIRLRPVGRRSQTMRLATGNGSIHLFAGGLDPAHGLRVEANTGMGGIHVNAADLIYERESTHVGHKRVVAQTRNFADAARVTIYARTGMGSIHIDQSSAG